MSEAYPDLKANQNMLQLQEELTSTENKVAFARQAYNDAVMEYNTKRESFPDTIFAGMFGFSAATLLEATESAEERKAPQGLVLSTFARHWLRSSSTSSSARRNTALLVLLFALAVVGVVAGRRPGPARALRVEHRRRARARCSRPWPRACGAVPAALYLWGAVGTAALILGGERLERRCSSPAAARRSPRWSARAAIAADTRDPLERRLLNVVEEMAIASGVRVPAVYVMDDERGINAFAAGYDASDAVVGGDARHAGDAQPRRAAGRDRRTSSATS